MRSKTRTPNNLQLQLIIGSVILAWLILLTAYVIDSRNQQMQQAKTDGEAIYKLMVENGIQQEKIDGLK